MPPDEPTVEPSIAVEVRDLSKSFGGVAALDSVDLELRVGEVHALLGENGAGKTTLSNILSGLYRADRGTVLIDGVEHTFSSPGQAIAAGIGMVHQHFRLVYPMTVAENLSLGSPDTPAVLSGKQLVERAKAMIDEFGLVVDPNARVWQLSVGEQQRVEILRVLARGAQVLILDEPTAVLTAHEASELFAVVRRLVAAGRTVVFISHKLNEVLGVSDRITVLRGGKRVVTRDVGGITPRELARLMTGEEIELVVEHREVTGATVLELTDVSVRNERGTTALDGVDLSVRAGEVVGIAGVSGNGQTELAEVITGLRACERGRVVIAGKDVTHGTPREIADLGVGHVPEDRIEQFAERMVADARVQTRSVDMPAAQMSGGNQQRLVARRESLIASTLLVAAHPTRGLDVLATKEVQSTIVERRDAGCAVLMSDRVAVMYEGRVLGVFDRAHIDREVIGLLMAGHTAGDERPDTASRQEGGA